MGDHTLFFYGTLMSPQILHRVIHGRATPEPWQRAYLTIRPAVLPNYRRHRVRHADYPGIVAGHASSASVLGTLVTGLTEGDVYRLDLFEGDEYTKVKVKVKGTATAPDGAEAEAEAEAEVEALTYVWTAGRERLEDAEWDFEAFKRDKMAWWVEADERDW
ncbi:gamma-glutamylcyclotransferase family protein [Aspergillus brunneoviolaceus CBS 621.78]|uniref:Uncharacterized protein n=1 Tax=Aspergillus brunneoviolaceus CBS 621.78 TaxID=1450534 RepID=A0ACD1GH02_9EURO|nr:hypothetical protein BO95DRAFT_407987 [Aspergillus brunneoviolaceus CBS 621.78]RAH48438.1 hypothetical protein BO95DRAFT_407987 [Aspergillus brunneoviolaceus CBS 621.78]